jgi:hypothetical protein
MSGAERHDVSALSVSVRFGSVRRLTATVRAMPRRRARPGPLRGRVVSVVRSSRAKVLIPPPAALRADAAASVINITHHHHQHCPVSGGPGRVRPSFLLSTANNQPNRSEAKRSKTKRICWASSDAKARPGPRSLSSESPADYPCAVIVNPMEAGGPEDSRNGRRRRRGGGRCEAAPPLIFQARTLLDGTAPTGFLCAAGWGGGARDMHRS